MAGVKPEHVFLNFVSALSHDLDIIILSVRPSVCLSRSGIVSKRLNVSSYFRQHVMAQSYYFSEY